MQEVGMLVVSIGSNRTQQYFDDNIKKWLDEEDDSDIK